MTFEGPCQPELLYKSMKTEAALLSENKQEQVVLLWIFDFILVF